MKTSAVFVTGATGFIGRYLIDDLLKGGFPIYALTRRNYHETALDKRVRLVKGDITEKLDLPGGISTVYHCAGIISQEDQMERVNVLGTQNIVDAALARNCRLLHLSSAGVIGKAKNNNINENSECHPQNRYEWSKREAEKIVLKGISMGLKAQILRPTIVFGTGRDPAEDSFLHLVRAIKSGRYRSIRNGRGIYNIVHATEVVRTLRALDDDSLPNGGIYFINSPISFKEFSTIVMNCAGSKQEVISNIPFPVAFIGAGLLSIIAVITGQKMPLTLSRLRALTDDRIFSRERLLQGTSYRPLSGVADYIRSVCREYKKKDLLE